jgi:hypothetical protein
MFSPKGVFRSAVARLWLWLPRPSDTTPNRAPNTGFLVTRLRRSYQCRLRPVTMVAGKFSRHRQLITPTPSRCTATATSNPSASHA